jgi:hypothetical protein
MKFLLLEDDDDWAGQISGQIKAAFPGAVLTRCATEWAFRQLLALRPFPSFDCALFDIMVRWAGFDEMTELGAMEDLPEDVEKEFEGQKKWRAGVRCRRLFLETLEQIGRKPVPCLFFTVLGSNELKDDLEKMNGHAPLVVKTDEHALLAEIRKLLG